MYHGWSDQIPHCFTNDKFQIPHCVRNDRRREVLGVSVCRGGAAAPTNTNLFLQGQRAIPNRVRNLFYHTRV